MPEPKQQCELTILMPCLNEAETLPSCIRKARSFLSRHAVVGEILVADNGSTDGSQRIAAQCGARVVHVGERGYGSALRAGIAAARGRYVIMGDSDDSYDFGALDAFLEQLRQGYDLVMGNRFAGGIRPGAMPPLHRYLGNPILSAIGRLFFGAACRDFHCGLRGFRRASILQLDLQAPGMEFASEMVVKATLRKLRMAEVPTILSPDGRNRPPHLRSWRDGWRHLRFLLLFSPRWLFLFPGAALFFLGLIGMAWLLPGPQRISGIGLDIHTLVYCAIATVIGFQSVLFWAFANRFAVREGLLPPDRASRMIADLLTLEAGLAVGGILLLVGFGLSLYGLHFWGAEHFGALSASDAMRIVLPAATAILLAFQLIYGGFFISVLGIPSARRSASRADARHADAA